MHRVLRRALERITDTKNPSSFVQPPSQMRTRANRHEMLPQYRGFGTTCELYVMERRKNRLDILEGQFSNKEPVSRTSRFQLEGCQGEICCLSPRPNEHVRPSQEYGMMDCQPQLAEL